MATPRWTGAAGDTDWNTVTNWSTGAKPVAGDTVIVSASATSSMLLNLDRTGDTAGAGLNVVLFEIEKGFRYNIGSITAPLRLSADKFADYGNGAVYFSTDTGSGNLPTDRCIIDKDDISKPVVLMGPLSLNTSTFTLIEITRGAQVTLGNTLGIATNITTLWIAPRNTQTDVGVTANAFFNTVDNVYMSGGTLTWEGLAIASGGGLYMGNGVLDFRSTTILELTQFGGTVLHNGTAANYAITTYNALGGYLISDETAGGKLISVLNRAPQWDMKYNPKLSVGSTNYIGG